MKRTVLLYGITGGLLIAGLKFIEYRFLVVEHSLEIYGGLVALVFSAVGLWLGRRLTRPAETGLAAVAGAAPASSGEPFVLDGARLQQLGITPREREILELIAAGLSNQEIADRLFVTQNTVKTHASRVFEKLNARRRTQAVRIAKAERLIP
ncbi:MAG: helix-turn-helix transcriptional regulator [Gemmatimonadaceae bacterium]